MLAQRLTAQQSLLQTALAKQAGAAAKVVRAQERLACVEQEHQQWSQRVADLTAASFVRWAAEWLSENTTTASGALQRVQASVKQSVRIAANTMAQVTWQSQGCLLRFTEPSPLADVELAVRTGGAFQLSLPLFKSCFLAPV